MLLGYWGWGCIHNVHLNKLKVTINPITYHGYVFGGLQN